ncbi:hypothetical protein C5O00_05830 [Pukyongia salina]|uniref:Thioredoxin domain-containing protein n=1 Tax=Pukyongia salina TaxID=2094025 RepID=A0A2S0HVS8_9FLAO|nr:TlpA disulfide reductase family protein [Pukyongia salina]AVI50716.1 hypothetical protein C5O00_05830 [Pukyongia salina]
MNRTIYLIIALVIIAFSVLVYTNKYMRENSSVQIIGEGFKDEFKHVTLHYFDHNELTYKEIKSQSLSADEKFEFSFPFENANLYQLSFDEKEYIPLSIEHSGTISIVRSEKKYKIEGSQSTNNIIWFEERNEQLQAKYFAQLKIDIDKAMIEDDQETIKNLTEQSEILLLEFLKEFREAIIDLGTTPAGYYALRYSDFNKEMDFVEERLVAFKKEAPNSLVTKALEKQVYQAKLTSIGNSPPQFETKDKEGKIITLNDYLGNVVLIDFWASWCRACRIENPKFAVLYETYKNKGFEIISISQDKIETVWLKSIEKDGIGAWVHIHDEDLTISKQFSISSLPQNLLLSGDGKIIAKNISAEELSTILSNL